MKRVVLVTSSMKMGGLNSVIEEHAQLFLSAGLDVSVVLLRRGGEVPSGLQGRVHYMPKIDSNSVFYLRILYALFRPFLRGIGNLFAGRRNARIFHEFLEESGVEADDLVAIHGFRTIAALRRVSHPRRVKAEHACRKGFRLDATAAIPPDSQLLPAGKVGGGFGSGEA